MNEQEHLTTSDLAGRRASPDAGPAEPSAGRPSPAPERDESSTASQAPGTERREGDVAQEQHGTSPLFDHSDREGFQERWRSIQTGFVDQPRRSVEQADALVAEAMSMLAETFAQERQALERQWGEGADVSTEDLRVALQRYRSFFERLLAA